MECLFRQPVMAAAVFAMLICRADHRALPQPSDPADDGFRKSAGRPDDRQPEELPVLLSRLLRDTAALNPKQSVRVDLQEKRVFLVTRVSCRNCVLEMLCVPRGQREHETILNVDARAVAVHTALLAVGLRPGRPAVFFPEYRPPEGPPLQLTVHWVDAQNVLRSADARSWIRHSIHRYFSWPLERPPSDITFPHGELRYDPVNKQLIWYGPMTRDQRDALMGLSNDEPYRKGIAHFFHVSQSRPMTATFVFAGSQWDTIEGTGRRVYAAEDGHLITVANFSAATIDVAEESTAADGGQLYEAWEDRIPPEGTPVLLEIRRRSEPTAGQNASDQPDASSTAPEPPQPASRLDDPP